MSSCGPCQGGLTNLTIRYTGGGIPLTVTAVDGEGNSLPGGINLLTNVITINSLAANEPFRGGSVTIQVLALLGALLSQQTIVTSCATPIFEGSAFGDFVILSGTSLNGGALCCIPANMDDVDPVFTDPCPGNIQLFTASSTCTASTSWDPPDVTDNCGDVSLVGSHNHNGTTFPLGITTVIYTATDDYNNTATCSFTVEVIDNIDPEITTCPTDFNVVADASCSYSIQNYTGLATATDYCDSNVTITQSPPVGTLLSGVGTTQLITLTATDDAGNTDVCTFTITTTDDIDPQITTCPTDFSVIADASCSYSVQNYTGLASATDNCDGNVTITQSPAVGTTLNGVGTTQLITLTATDDAGNTDVCAFTITLTDDTDPQITCPIGFSVVVDASCSYGIQNYTGLAMATDNCDGNVTISQSPAEGTLLSGVGTTQLITLTATDDAGNAAVCTFTITLTDDTDPQITTCPADFSVGVDASCSYSIQNYTGLAAATDNCDSNVTITQSPAVGTMLNGVGTTQLITLTATDDVGNTDVCTFTITLTDDTDPQITTCPADFNVVVDASCSYSIQNYTGLATATDNCDGNVTITQSPAAGTMLNSVGTTQLITLTATDDAGNTEVCTFTITLTDDTDPQITICPADFNVVVDASCSYAIQNYIGAATAIDNCDSNVTITQTPAMGTLLSGAGTTQVITLEATDDAGNTDVCTFTITLTDDTDPQFTTCPANFNVVADASCSYSIQNYTGLAAATDNCDSNVTITQSPAVGTVLNGIGATQLITLTATDDAGNTDVCTFTITLTDDTDPQITTCPSDFSVVVDASCSYGVQNYTGLATATDNCDSNVTITQSPAEGTTLSGVGTTQLITLTATDDAGNTDVCTFTITLTDDTGPLITTCPADLNVVVDASCSYSVQNYTGLAAATDNCDGNVTITQSPAVGSVLSGIGTTQLITLTATDDAGNTDVCTFTITLTDDIDPQITACPADFNVVVDASCSYSIQNYTGLATASDNCDSNVTITQSPAVGTMLSGVGTTQLITLTATDDAGNTDVCTFVITLTDDTDPQFTTCSTDFNVVVDASCSYQVQNYTGLAAATDNCDSNVTITQSPAAGTMLSGAGTTQLITLTATDDAGNTTVCAFTITLDDDTDPQFTTCPSDLNVVVDASCSYSVQNYTGLAAATDNCDGNVTITQSPAVGSVLSGIGTTQLITLTATDDAGNTDVCTFTITLTDDIDPQITACPADFNVVVDASCSYRIQNYTGSATATDNCDSNVTLTQSPAVGTLLSGVGTTQLITLTATDDSGNTDVCMFTITLTDDTDPQITTCPADSNVVADASCSYSIQNYTGLATATDNCDDNVTITQSPAVGTMLSGTGTTQLITLTATDDAGNTAVCTFTITLIDDTDPQVTTCPTDFSVVANASCSYSLQDYTGLATATDNCDGNVTITQSPAVGTLLNGVGTTQQITLTVTDDAGNTDMCSFIITLTDDTDPQFTTCPIDFDVTADASCSYSIENYTGLAAASDNCDGNVTITQSPAAGTMLNGVGTTQQITLTATDDAGNVDICTFTIRLIDSSLPVISGCPTDIVVSSGASSCDAIVNWVEPTASDNCSVVLTGSHNSGDLFLLGETTVTYKAQDQSGNVATCSFRVIVEDKAPPVFSNCVSRVNTTAASGSCEATASWTPPTASDKCGSATVTSSHSPGDVFPVGTTRVTYTATDAKGNSALCQFDVVVGSLDKPVITGCPADLDVRITEPGAVAVNWTEPAATVSCGTVTMSASHDPGDRFDPGTTEVVYTATDDEGQITECRFNIVVAYEEIVLEIGKVITPNGDGVNDEWALQNIEKFKDNKVTVVDRWGGVVFSATGYNNDNVVWNGDNRHGSGVPTGTYFYTITVRLGPSYVEKTGFIELIR